MFEIIGILLRNLSPFKILIQFSAMDTIHIQKGHKALDRSPENGLFNTFKNSFMVNGNMRLLPGGNVC